MLSFCSSDWVGLSLARSILSEHCSSMASPFVITLVCKKLRLTVGNSQNIYKMIREISNQIWICLSIFRLFIKFGIMGWIWIDFAFLNTLYKCQIHRFFYFFENQPSNLGCYFWEKEVFFRTRHFPFIFAKPLYQNVRIDHRITLFVFVKQWKIIVN